MVTRRFARRKGASHEYDCQASLKQIYPDIYKTCERGFQLQYDLRTDEHKIVFEAKRLKGMAWNQAKKYFNKLREKAPKDYHSILLFKSNQQPCLVMFLTLGGKLTVREFEDVFGVPFIKYTPIKRIKKEEKDEN